MFSIAAATRLNSRLIVQKSASTFASFSLKRQPSLARTAFLKQPTNIITKRYYNSPVKFRDNYENRNKILYTLIGSNFVIYSLWFVSESDAQLRMFMNKYFTISNYSFFQQHLYFTTITSFFSHKDIAHILFNMLALYTFGQTVIHMVGAPSFLALYFGGGVVSSLCQTLWPAVVPSHWPARRNSSIYSRSLGASGAINAIVTWYIFLAPRSSIYIWGVLPVPAALFGVAYIGLDAYSLYFGGGDVGNAAHLGGAAFGALMFLLRRGRSSFRRF
eukprot:gene13909-15350_t